MSFPTKTVLALCSALLLFALNATAGIIYVKAGASGTGTSWANAYGSVQAALTAAAAGDDIWVAAGTYMPTTDPTDRTATFKLKNGVNLYGGFAGTETTLIARDSTGATNTTILSGELQGDGNPYNNSFRVVVANTDSFTQLNGFTVTDGCGNDINGYIDYTAGAGVLNVKGNTILANLVVKNCQAKYGGGIASFDGSPKLIRVTFIQDSGFFGGGMYNDASGSFSFGLSGAITYYPSMKNAALITDSFTRCYAAFAGGGMCSITASTTLEKVTFYRNTALDYGGGLYSDNSDCSITRSKFIGNLAVDTSSGFYGKGGGMFYDATGVFIMTLRDVLFSKNHAGKGGGIFTWYPAVTAAPELSNITFSGNTGTTLATYSDADGLGNSVYNQAGPLAIRNCIIDSTPNGNRSVSGDMGTCVIRNSLLPGGIPADATDSGYNLLYANPMFTDTLANDCSLLPGSPAVNAGNDTFAAPGTDLAGNPRIYQDTVDMGAYEWQGIHQPTITNTLTENNDIKVYPNPTDFLLHIDAPPGTYSSLSDMTGRIILYQQQTRQLDLSTLPPGVYLLHISNENGASLKTIKVVKHSQH